MRGMFRAEELLDLTHCPFPDLFEDTEHAWDALGNLADVLTLQLRPARLGKAIGQPYVANDVFIGMGTVVEPGVVIKGPSYIGANCEVRANAYIRGHVIVGDGCVLGNACEFKNCVLFNGAQVPHFSYVGDSILGHRAHLGAGVILSNLKSTAGNVKVGDLDTGRRKFGAIVGDGADIGCNCVLSPGSIIGRRAILYPNILWRGVCPPDRIVKLRQEQQIIERRK